MNNQTLIEKYLVWLEINRGRSPETSRKYNGYLQRLIGHFKSRDVCGLSRDEIELFVGPVAVDAGLAGKSRIPLVAAVRGFYAWLARAGYVTNNPASDIPYPKAATKLPIPITLGNAERLIGQPDMNTFLGLRDTAMFSVLMGCGMRISGMTSLHDEDLVVTEHRDKKRYFIRVTEKGQKERGIPLPEEAHTLILAYLGHPYLDGINRQAADGRHVLFVSTHNMKLAPGDYFGEERRISEKTVSDRIILHGKRAGIPMNQLRAHAMRHLYGAELTEDDTGLLLIQTLLGHSSPDSTKIYSHIATRKLMDAVDKSNPLSKMKTPVSGILKDL